MGLEQDILTTYTTIVVVGLASNPEKPSHWVSEYMRGYGYRIIGVNPDETEVFGLPCYPDLASVRESPRRNGMSSPSSVTAAS